MEGPLAIVAAVGTSGVRAVDGPESGSAQAVRASAEATADDMVIPDRGMTDVREGRMVISVRGACEAARAEDTVAGVAILYVP
jgi:hypothetical protein